MLRKRIVTAIVITAVLFGVMLWLPPTAALVVLAMVIAGGAREWALFAGLVTLPARALYALVVLTAVFGLWQFIGAGTGRLHPVLWLSLAWWVFAFVWIATAPQRRNRTVAAVSGLLVMVPAAVSLAYIYRMPWGPQWVLFLLLLVWAADVCAFFVGRTFGRVKLAPRVSPNKTWEGLIGGVIGSLAVAAAGAWWFSRPPLAFVSLCLGVVLISVVGDLTESMFKRYAGLKDSGRLLPGHGGMLDRFDSVFAAAPTFLLGLLWLEHGP